MSLQPDRALQEFLDRDRRAPDDDPHRGAEYEARCLQWESLTDEDIWGPGGRPPLPPIPPLVSAR